MIIQNKKIIASILFVLTGLIGFAQKGAEVPPPSRMPPPPGLPIDNAVIVLFIVALIYGIKKRYDLLKP